MSFKQLNRGYYGVLKRQQAQSEPIYEAATLQGISGSGAGSLDHLPRTQRLRVCKKLRQEQLKRYYEQERADHEKGRRLSGRRPQTPNSKGVMVNFDIANKLRDAVARFDDKEVLTLLDQNGDPNTASESGVTLLHQCCMDDNLSVAEILVQKGADVNQKDEDQWTPLHSACACDSTEIVQLLLNNGADPTLIDVDGNIPSDQAPAGSETKMVIETHMKDNGFDDVAVKNIKKKEAKRMLADVKDFIATGGNVNTANNRGTTLLHIAAANNYRDVAKLLLDRGANIDVIDDEGITPLHVAAKYGQTKMVKLLVKRNANPRVKNVLEQKAADLASSELIEELLKAADRDYNPVCPPSPLPDPDDEDEVELERVNSKTLRSRATPLSKTDQLFEAETRIQDEGDSSPTAKAVEEEENFQGIGLKVVKEDDSANEKVYLPSPTKSDDLAMLPEMTENVILQELMLRYSRDIIYTYVGDILVAVNPFKELPIYSRNSSNQYSNLLERSKRTPHMFAVADRAFQSMLRERRSQCCIISGESGAGKTESCKYFVQHLLSRANSCESLLNEKIEQVNPLLECFGNAQTVMNDNSSRFGKYLELKFSAAGNVVGAHLSEYLLEKSRIVSHGEGERNFHIFYLLFDGLTHDEKEYYGLKSPGQHRYMRSEGKPTLGLTNQQAKFRAVRDCLRLIGFSNEDEESLFSVLSAILLLGDLNFCTQENSEAAILTNPDVAEKAGELLHIPGDEIVGAILSETSYTRGESITKHRTPLQAADCRDALTKALYSRLFSWVVNNINQLLEPLEINQDNILEIGVLDIFGFENFIKNSFEQLCINLANEQLQHYFNEHIFQNEQEECEREGIQLNRVNFTSNQPVLDVFLEKHLSITALIDEESHFPKGTNQSLATKLHAGPGVRSKAVYKTPKDLGMTFSVLHYAGIVCYNVGGFLEKNRDTLAKSVLFTMKTSNKPLIRELFQNRLTRTGSLAPSARQRQSRRTRSVKNSKDAFAFFRKQKLSGKESRQQKRGKGDRPVVGTERKGPATVLFHFKNSLAELMGKMKRSSPHFVRCIKPNTHKLPDKFTPEYVVAQLRYTGIMETSRIRKQGFPLRLTPEEFVERYAGLVAMATIKVQILADLEKCRFTLKALGITGWQIGKTKLFFHYWHVEKLAELSANIDKRLLCCQKVIRGFLVRRQMKHQWEIVESQRKYIASFLSDIQLKGETLIQTLNKCEEGCPDDDKQEEEEEKEIEEEEKEEFQHALNDHDEARNVEKMFLDVAESEESRMSAIHTVPPPPPLTNGTCKSESAADSAYDTSQPPSPGKISTSTEDDVFHEGENGATFVPPPPLAFLNGNTARKEEEDELPEDCGYVSMKDAPPALKKSLKLDNNENETAEKEKSKKVEPSKEETDLLPPPPPVDQQAMASCPNQEFEFPPPPPMAEIAGDTKENIAAIRARFKQQEDKPKDEPLRATSPPRKKIISLAPVIADGAKSENRPEVTSPSKSRIAERIAQLKEQEVASERESTRPAGGVAVTRESEYVNSPGSDQTVKRRPPAPVRDPNTRLTMIENTSVQRMSYGNGMDVRMVRTQSQEYRIQSQYGGLVYDDTVVGSTYIDNVAYRNSMEHTYGIIPDVPPPPVQAPPPPPPQIPHRGSMRPMSVAAVPPPPAHAPPPVPPPMPSANTNNTNNIFMQIPGANARPRSGILYPDDVPPPPGVAPPAPPQPPPVPSGPKPTHLMSAPVTSPYAPPPPPPPAVASFTPPPPPPPVMGGMSTQHIPAPPPVGGMVPPPPPAPNAPPPPPPPAVNKPTGGLGGGGGGGLLDGLSAVQLKTVSKEKKKSVSNEGPMDNLMAELQNFSGRLRPTPKQSKPPSPEIKDETDNGVNQFQLKSTKTNGTRSETPSPPQQPSPPQHQNGNNSAQSNAYRLSPNNNSGPPPTTPKSPKPTPMVMPKPAKGIPASPTMAPPAPPIAPAAPQKSFTPPSPPQKAPVAPPPTAQKVSPKSSPKRQDYSKRISMPVETRPLSPTSVSAVGERTRKVSTPSLPVSLPVQLPEGYDNMPAWKKAMVDKKLKDAMAKEEEERRKQEEEQSKWKGVPEWKRKLVIEKEKKKEEEAEASVDKNKEERDAKLRSMPTWKRNIVKKKHGGDGEDGTSKGASGFEETSTAL
ncbi:unconventional myosin-XVI-like isoform X4 [Lytechinus variegatus]|uniref:unconventional myosin-XVI-like isoform X4 n=1 Tax=Lytechinus variegatus TaxID=7654 RepID=UPI001BB15AC6|nr:unconventional myosin-XVI-like isoform X4 [Lytechinus variegatus]